MMGESTKVLKPIGIKKESHITEANFKISSNWSSPQDTHTRTYLRMYFVRFDHNVNLHMTGAFISIEDA